MTTLFDNVVDRKKVWRGAGRVLIADSGTSFPGVLESVIQPGVPATGSHETPYSLGAAWSDIGGTTTDGVTVTRGFDGEDAVEVDQLKYGLFGGAPTAWRMQVAATMLHTDPDSLAIAWEMPTTVSIAEGTGPDYNVAQTKGKFSAPDSLTERLLAVVQQHPEDSDRLRLFVFRKAKLSPEDSEMAIQSGEASGAAVTFDCQADTSVDNDEDPFGVVYDEDTA